MDSLQLSEIETILNANKGEDHNLIHKFSVNSCDIGLSDFPSGSILNPLFERVFDFSGFLRSKENISTPTLSSDFSAQTSLPQVVLDATAIVHGEKYPGEGSLLPAPVVNFVDSNQNAEESDITTSYYSDDSNCGPITHPIPEFSQLTSPGIEVASTSQSRPTFQWPPYTNSSLLNSGNNINPFNKVAIKSEEFDLPPCQNTHYGAVSTADAVSFPPFAATSPSTSIPSPTSTIYSASSPGTPGTSTGSTRGRRPHGSTAPYTTKTSRRRQVEKGTVEYVEKRARNNVAVRKSRAKAKERQRSTETHVKALLDHNDQLQKKVDLLTKELTVLKGLFMNGNVSIPDEFLSMIEDS